MKHITRLLSLTLTALLLAPAVLRAAAEPLITELSHSNSKPLVESLGLTALWSIVGVILAIIGFKIFDRCTPGNLQQEIVGNKNVAAAIIGAAIILGVCLIIAAAIMG